MNRNLEGAIRSSQDVSWAAKIGPSPWETSQKGVGNSEPIVRVIRSVVATEQQHILPTPGLIGSGIQNGDSLRQKVWGGKGKNGDPILQPEMKVMPKKLRPQDEVSVHLLNGISTDKDGNIIAYEAIGYTSIENSLPRQDVIVDFSK